MSGFWGQITISLRSEAKHPKGGPKARGICALTPKTPASGLSAWCPHRAHARPRARAGAAASAARAAKGSRCRLVDDAQSEMALFDHVQQICADLVKRQLRRVASAVARHSTDGPGIAAFRSLGKAALSHAAEHALA